MANPEHLEILKQGLVQWIQWREENRGERRDLSDEYPSDEDFSYEDLTIENFDKALPRSSKEKKAVQLSCA